MRGQCHCLYMHVQFKPIFIHWSNIQRSYFIVSSESHEINMIIIIYTLGNKYENFASLGITRQTWQWACMLKVITSGSSIGVIHKHICLWKDTAACSIKPIVSSPLFIRLWYYLTNHIGWKHYTTTGTSNHLSTKPKLLITVSLH